MNSHDYMVMRIDCNTHKEALCINDNFCDVLHVSTILFIVLWFGHCVSMDIHAFTLMMRQTNSQFNFFFRLRHRFEMKFVKFIVCCISLGMDFECYSCKSLLRICWSILMKKWHRQNIKDVIVKSYLPNVVIIVLVRQEWYLSLLFKNWLCCNLHSCYKCKNLFCSSKIILKQYP